jgi:hypothetical protein
MTSGRSLLASALVVVAASGCAAGAAAGPERETTPLPGVVVLAKADGWRSALNDTKAIDYFTIAEVAYDEATARAAWDDTVPADLPERDGEPHEPGRYGDLADVDFREQAVVVYSAGQSGTCPAWVSDLVFEDGTVEVTEDGHTPGDACTDDYRAYRLVLAVDRERLPPPEALPTEQVLVDGYDRPAVVAGYPFR